MTENQSNISYKRVIQLAWPASIAALVTPVLGLVDSAALGLSARPLDIGAIGLAGSIYSLLYWAFGFLRMSTAGLTAQAHGAQDPVRVRKILGQSTLFGFLIGLGLLILSWPIIEGLFWIFTIDSAISQQTEQAARTYLYLRLWAAPFSIACFGLFGWLTALGRTGLLLLIVFLMTLLNGILDIVFVVQFHLGAKGVALGTLIAETLGFFGACAAVLFVLHQQGGIKAHWPWRALTHPEQYRALIAVNGDVFLRSALLSASFAYFIQRGSLFGDVTLAANQVLLQLVLVTGLALDGAAIAAETLVGQAIGNRDPILRRKLYAIAVRRTSIVAGVGAILFTLLFAVAGGPLVRLIAHDPQITRMAMAMIGWAIISPLIVVTCFQLDGIFIGATRFRAMRNSMLISSIFFIILAALLIPPLGNHGLWLSFWIFMLMRAVTMGWQFPTIGRDLRGEPLIA